MQMSLVLKQVHILGFEKKKKKRCFPKIHLKALTFTFIYNFVVFSSTLRNLTKVPPFEKPPGASFMVKEKQSLIKQLNNFSVFP